jgi:hypothetical protein
LIIILKEEFSNDMENIKNYKMVLEARDKIKAIIIVDLYLAFSHKDIDKFIICLDMLDAGIRAIL